MTSSHLVWVLFYESWSRNRKTTLGTANLLGDANVLKEEDGWGGSLKRDSHGED